MKQIIGKIFLYQISFVAKANHEIGDAEGGVALHDVPEDRLAADLHHGLGADFGLFGQARAHALWAGIPDSAYFYFVHSFYVQPSDPRHSVGETDYGTRFTCALARDNIFATQFHPEKSAEHGLALYRNFLHWKP